MPWRRVPARALKENQYEGVEAALMPDLCISRRAALAFSPYFTLTAHVANAMSERLGRLIFARQARSSLHFASSSPIGRFMNPAACN